MASVLKDYVHCPICYELFEGADHEPFALQCLHTLCKRCIKQIATGTKFKCPQCKATCDREATKKDFRTQSLVDDYMKEKTKSAAVRDSGSLSVPKCGMCDDSGKTLKSRCVDCQLFLCPDCEKGHKKLPALKSHTIESLSFVTKNLETSIKKTILEFEKMKNTAIQGKSAICADRSRMDKVQEEAIRKINKLRKKQHKDIDNYHDNLIKRVHEEKVKLQDKSTSGEVKIDSLIKDIQGKTTMLSELLKKKDKSKTLGPGDAANKQVKEDLAHLQSLMTNHFKQKVKFTVDVQETKLLLNETTCTKVTITGDITDQSTDQQENSTSQTNISTSNADEAQNNNNNESDLVSVKLDYNTLVKCIDVTGTGRRIHIINQELWCCTREALHVYTLEGELKQSIYWEITEEWASSVIPAPVGNDLIVSFYHTGMLVINREGRPIETLREGEFSDVTSCGEEVFALEWEDKSVCVFKQYGNRWRQTGLIRLNYEESHSCDKLHVVDDVIYVSSWFNNCIYMFTLEGDLLDCLGGSNNGEQSDGSLPLDGPKLCTVDQYGSCLIADSGNGRLLWCSLSGNIQDINVPVTTIGQPEDGEVSQSDDSLWTLSYRNGYKLLKFV